MSHDEKMAKKVFWSAYSDFTQGRDLQEAIDAEIYVLPEFMREKVSEKVKLIQKAWEVCDIVSELGLWEMSAEDAEKAVLSWAKTQSK